MSTLFENEAPQPLADRLRPRNLAEIVGQDHLLAPDGPIGRMMASRRLSSMILWGPPGCGKTTIARLLAQGTDLAFEPLSAVFSGVADLRKVFDAARKRREMGSGTLLFVDEIHRFNRAQQDAFLPVVEDGTVILVGATTENPSFELIGALLSRAHVLVLRRLDDDALETLLRRAEQHLGHELPLTGEARAALRTMADGDGRFLLNMVEEIAGLPQRNALDPRELARLVQQRAPLYDKAQEGHYNLISALHKSLARLGHRCGTLLAGADAGRRRGPDLYPAAADPRGGRGYRPRRSAGRHPGARGVGHLRPARLARRRAGDRPMRDLSRHRAQIERRLPGLWRGAADGRRDRLA